MENIDFATLFQGIGTMMASGWFLASARIFLVLLGLLLIYLGWKGVLEPMVMIPMGLGMVAMEPRFRVPSGFTATLPEVSGTCLTQTMIFISICLLSYFTPRAREMTMRWTSEVPS